MEAGSEVYSGRVKGNAAAVAGRRDEARGDPGGLSEPIKNAALRSYLSILLEKGHVKRRLVGKAYYYRAVTAEQSAFQNLLGQLVETFFGGSKQRLLMSLVESEKLTAEQLKELQQAARADHDSTKPQAAETQRVKARSNKPQAKHPTKRVTKRRKP